LQNSGISRDEIAKQDEIVKAELMENWNCMRKSSGVSMHSACSARHYWNTSCDCAGPANGPLLIAGLILLCFLLPALVVMHWAQEVSRRMTFH